MICRCCGNNSFINYLNLGKQPLANSYHKGEILPTYPLEVDLCRFCFHSQLSIVVPPHLMFNNYLYVGGTTKTFRNHWKALAESVDVKNVLDIGCNDGTLLNCFYERGANPIGVDPAKNLAKIHNFPVYTELWSKDLAKKLPRQDLVVATNVFAHVDNIKEFLEACEIITDKVILEFPYGKEMILNCEFDTIYHEHLSYFLIHSFLALVNRTCFKIEDIITTSIHGGSIRITLNKTKHTDKIDLFLEEEEKQGLTNYDTYHEFAKQVEKNKKDMKELLSTSKAVGYGASAKGNTMLNYFEIDLDYIVDDNTMKQGFLTPGRNIPIVSPDLLRKDSRRNVVVLAWNFLDEIKEKMNRPDNYIVYIPRVRTNA